MLTVPQAAERVGRKPETVRRWIREGRLRASKIGTQHVIEERDLEGAAEERVEIAVPRAWAEGDDGSESPDWAALVDRSRGGR